MNDGPFPLQDRGLSVSRSANGSPVSGSSLPAPASASVITTSTSTSTTQHTELPPISQITHHHSQSSASNSTTLPPIHSQSHPGPSHKLNQPPVQLQHQQRSNVNLSQSPVLPSQTQTQTQTHSQSLYQQRPYLYNGHPPFPVSGPGPGPQYFPMHQPQPQPQQQPPGRQDHLYQLYPPRPGSGPGSEMNYPPVQYLQDQHPPQLPPILSTNPNPNPSPILNDSPVLPPPHLQQQQQQQQQQEQQRPQQFIPQPSQQQYYPSYVNNTNNGSISYDQTNPSILRARDSIDHNHEASKKIFNLNQAPDRSENSINHHHHHHHNHNHNHISTGGHDNNGAPSQTEKKVANNDIQMIVEKSNPNVGESRRNSDLANPVLSSNPSNKSLLNNNPNQRLPSVNQVFQSHPPLPHAPVKVVRAPSQFQVATTPQRQQFPTSNNGGGGGGGGSSSNSTLNEQQLKRVKENNAEVLQSLTKHSSAKNNTKLSQDAINELEQRLMNKFPDSIPLPGLPVIAQGYVPMMMSPQGIIVPLKYEPLQLDNGLESSIVPAFTPLWKKSITRSNDDSTPRRSPNPNTTVNGPECGSHNVSENDTESPSDYPVTKRKRNLRSSLMIDVSSSSPSNKGITTGHNNKKIKFNPEDKLAAFRLCLISEESFERLKLNYKNNHDSETFETPMEIKYSKTITSYQNLDLNYYTYANYSAIKERYLEKFSILSSSNGDSKDNELLRGLERDMVEKKDYSLVRNELYKNYVKGKIYDSLMDESLEVYSHICLEYSLRLLKFKKFLLNQKDLLRKGKGQLYLVESSKSERLWRLFLNDLEVSNNSNNNNNNNSSSTVDNKREISQILTGGVDSEHDSDCSSSAVSSSGNNTGGADAGSTANANRKGNTVRQLSTRLKNAQVKSKIRQQLRNNNSSKKKNVNSVPVLDGLCPILKEEEFRLLTDPKSKLFENIIAKSNNSEVKSLSDFKDLIEYFDYKSNLRGLLSKYSDKTISRNSSVYKSKKMIRDIQLEENRHLSDTANSDRLSSDEKRSSKIRSNSRRNLVQYGYNTATTNGGSFTFDDVDRNQILVNERELANSFTKVYNSPVGLTNSEIENDLKDIWSKKY